MRTTFIPILIATAVLALGPGQALGQTGTTLSGTVTQADGGQPMAGALVVIDELRRETRTADDGTYRFEGVPPGNYHVGVRAEGYTTRRTEVTVGTSPATLDLSVEFDLHFAEVVSVSPNPRPQFESYQPTSVLTGQDLTRQLDSTVAGTLQSEPGIATRSFGAAPARPVIRGLDGDRVVVLEDGQRMGDISSQSGDHGVPINPAAASKMEVVRGPATLLYGANAIGGLVNVITDQIPTERFSGTSGNFTFDVGTNGGQAGGAGDIHVGNGEWAFHFGGSGQRMGDYSTPEGTAENTQSRTGTASVGGAWTGEHSYVGASYGYTDQKYGIPVVEEGQISLTPRRHAFNIRAGGSALPGFIQSYRATFGLRRYEHQELEGTDVGTIFDNDTLEGEVLLSHRKTGALLGSVGGWLLNRQFAARGAEALSPPVDQNSLAAFAYEEVAWSHATLQFGGRLDHTTYTPETALPTRDFTEWSSSVGLLIRPEAANDNLVIAASLARAARAPALEELYFFGPHLGNFAYEIGNPDLEAERALGLDLAVRVRGDRFEGEVSFFHNAISNFIFRNPISDEEFEEREEEFDERFGVEHEGDGEDDGHAHGGDLPYVEFVGRDATLWGFEAHGDVKLTPEWTVEFTFDMVRGRLTDTDEPLPRIPPYRGIAGLRYQRNAFQAGAAVTAVADQDRVYGDETPTSGWATLRFHASYSFTQGRVLNTITARLENATNQLYRNHLNYLKDQLPELGRTFRLVYALGF
ncbi:MAG: TonB-dependent receptor [Acidobacteria bacterium]|nr:TonB-dependent receptor [Acidobacteriota bacterium]